MCMLIYENNLRFHKRVKGQNGTNSFLFCQNGENIEILRIIISLKQGWQEMSSPAIITTIFLFVP